MPLFDAEALLASGGARLITVHSESAPPPAAEANIITLKVPYGEGTSTTHAASIADLEHRHAARRRAACARAAAARLGGEQPESEPDDSSDDDEDHTAAPQPQHMLEIFLETPDVAGSIGGKVWDSAPLLSAWLAENRDAIIKRRGSSSSAPPLRILELGAGLGVVGLALGKLLGDSAHITISDYDPACVEATRRNICHNFPSTGGSSRPDACRLDFRDFTPACLDDPASAAAGPLAEYAALGLLGSIDLVVAADIVYEPQGTPGLAYVLKALLKKRSSSSQPPKAKEDDDLLPPDDTPCALLALPDGRPRLAQFVSGLEQVGLRVRIEQVSPSCGMARALKAESDGAWGAARQTFSLYVVSF